MLHLKGVRFSYPGSKDAQIRGVDLDIPRGAFVGIAGPNGAGKSTLLKLMAGLLPPQAGEILLEGKPLRDYPRRALAVRMAWAAQSPAFTLPMTVEEFVQAGRFPRLGFFAPVTARDLDRVHRSLEALELGSLSGQSILEISGGERQLAVLARALTSEADVLLLDEPLAHLDPRHHLLIFRVLRAEQRIGRTLLMTSHDYNALRLLAQRLLLFREGRILSDVPAGEAGPAAWEALFDVAFREVRDADGRGALILPSPTADEFDPK